MWNLMSIDEMWFQIYEQKRLIPRMSVDSSQNKPLPLPDWRCPIQSNCHQVLVGLFKRRRYINGSELVLTGLTFAVEVARLTSVSGSLCFWAHEYPLTLPLWLYLVCTHFPALEWLMTKIHYCHLDKLFDLFSHLMSFLESMLYAGFKHVTLKHPHCLPIPKSPFIWPYPWTSALNLPFFFSSKFLTS